MYNILFTSQYRKCRRMLIRRGYDMSKLDNTIILLSGGKPLPAPYKDHPLKGDFKGERECHVEGLSDWLLTYRKEKDKLILLLTGTGTHADLFE